MFRILNGLVFAKFGAVQWFDTATVAPFWDRVVGLKPARSPASPLADVILACAHTLTCEQIGRRYQFVDLRTLCCRTGSTQCRAQQFSGFFSLASRLADQVSDFTGAFISRSMIHDVLPWSASRAPVRRPRNRIRRYEGGRATVERR